MFADPAPLLAMGARAHAVLAGQSADAIARAFERDDWTCQRCGTRVPQYVEVAHMDGHRADCSSQDLLTVCQFCHALDHPVWAASRGRLRLIACPDVPQMVLQRLAWSVYLFAAEDADAEEQGRAVYGLERFEQQTEALLAAVDARERLLTELLGGVRAESFFESLFTARDLLTAPQFERLLTDLDRIVRFWPSAASEPEGAEQAPGAQVSRWRESGFEPVGPRLRAAYFDDAANSGRVTLERLTDLAATSGLKLGGLT